MHSQVLTYFLRQILHQNLALGWRLELQVLLELLKVDNIALRLSIAHFEALLKHLGESRLDFVKVSLALLSSVLPVGPLEHIQGFTF